MISILPESGKKVLTISIFQTDISTLRTNYIDVAIIDADTYRTDGWLKEDQIFAVSIKDLEY